MAEVERFQAMFTPEEVAAMCAALACTAGDRHVYVGIPAYFLEGLGSMFGAMLEIPDALRPWPHLRAAPNLVPDVKLHCPCALSHAAVRVGRLMSPGGVVKSQDSIRDTALLLFARQVPLARWEVLHPATRGVGVSASEHVYVHGAALTFVVALPLPVAL